jgi:hypothetical protein
MERTINVFNDKHLGDCILSTHFLRNVCDKNPDIDFNFYFDKKYRKKIEMQAGDMLGRINMDRLKNKPNDAINLWFASRKLPQGGRVKRRWASNERYDMFHDVICEEWEIENPIPGKHCTVIDLPAILDPVDVECDFLFLNSKSRSGYYQYEKRLMREKAREWNERFKVVTAEPTVDNIPSARELDLSLIEIGHLATKAKYVVAVDTGTIHNCFNKWALENVEQWWILSNRTTRTYNDRIKAFRSIKKVEI